VAYDSGWVLDHGGERYLVSYRARVTSDDADRPIFRIVTSCDIGGS
jgi:hypothetical protein